MSRDRVNKIAQELEQEFITGNYYWNFSVPDINCYANNLPDGITMEIVEKVEEYNADFVQASVKVFGNLAIRALANEPELGEILGNVKLPKDSSLHLRMCGNVKYDAVPACGLIEVVEENNALEYPNLKEVQSDLSKLALEKLSGKKY